MPARPQGLNLRQRMDVGRWMLDSFADPKQGSAGFAPHNERAYGYNQHQHLALLDASGVVLKRRLS
ncbi:hypothetical protein D9757_013242 [Collybiopsis confluens]|uniref:Uncharacterized protein n=1 Tax=Collybiopsis confluens TaxID=2823264 RepID=A0A8H5FWM1_9AGAR|nr:hypothetical protein D9757_013242 [Collybiopsis confluens]